MSDCLSLLDQALDMGKQELESLAEGRDEAILETASERCRLIEQAFESRGKADVDLFLGKLKQLKNMQGRLITEARRLHETLARDLAHAKQENKRLTGYKNSRTPAPVYSRFVSKQG